MQHVAYNRSTGEVLATPYSGNYLKRWLARHIANDREWYARHNQPCPPNNWHFAHGKNFADCWAKLDARGIIRV